MSELPAGWVDAEIGEIAETRLGKMLSRKAKIGSDPRPYLNNKSVRWGRVDIANLPTMDFGPEEVDRFRVDSGDLLVCEGGEVGRAAIWQGQVEWVGYQKALHRVRPVNGVSSEFLLWCFMWLAQSHALEKHVTGSTIKHLPQENLRRIRVPLPPIAEQVRIATAVSAGFARLEVADERLEMAKRRMQRMSLGLLGHAFRDSRATCRLDGVAEVRLGRQRSPKNHVGPNMVPYLRAANVTWAGLDLSDVKSMNFTPAEVANYRLVEGDLVLSEASGSADEVGKSAVWRGELDCCCFQNTLIRVRPRDVDSHYLNMVFLRDALAGRFAESAPGVGIHHLGSTRLSAWPIPMASDKDQIRIAANLQRELALVASLAAGIERAKRRSTHLRRAILERAFSGQLVPQDASDEPAAGILDRARSNRPALGSKLRRPRLST